LGSSRILLPKPDRIAVNPMASVMHGDRRDAW
jgi:hypothetical protein